MKNVITLIILFVTSLSLSQTIPGVKIDNKLNYSEASEIKVFYNDSLEKLHSKIKPAAIFVNGTFVGNTTSMNTINSEKIESLKIEKENFEKNGKEYYGKF